MSIVPREYDDADDLRVFSTAAAAAVKPATRQYGTKSNIPPPHGGHRNLGIRAFGQSLVRFHLFCESWSNERIFCYTYNVMYYAYVCVQYHPNGSVYIIREYSMCLYILLLLLIGTFENNKVNLCKVSSFAVCNTLIYTYFV